MGQTTDSDAKSAEERFEATVKQLLATPPRPDGAKKRPGECKSLADRCH